MEISEKCQQWILSLHVILVSIVLQLQYSNCDIVQYTYNFFFYVLLLIIIFSTDFLLSF